MNFEFTQDMPAPLLYLDWFKTVYPDLTLADSEDRHYIWQFGKLATEAGVKIDGIDIAIMLGKTP